MIASEVFDDTFMNMVILTVIQKKTLRVTIIVQGDPESTQLVDIISFLPAIGNDIDELRTFWITLYKLHTYVCESSGNAVNL